MELPISLLASDTGLVPVDADVGDKVAPVRRDNDEMQE